MIAPARLLAAAALGAGLTCTAACASEVPMPSLPGSAPTATSPTPSPTAERDTPSPSDSEVLAFSLPDRVSDRVCAAFDTGDSEYIDTVAFAYATPEVPPIAVIARAAQQSCPRPLVVDDAEYAQTEARCAADTSLPECAS